MRRALIVLLSLTSILAVASCGAKQETAQTESTVDSLLASNPTEQTAGDLTPQTEYQEPQPQEPVVQAPPPASPRPKPKPKVSAPPPDYPASTPSSERSGRGVRVPSGTPVKIAVNAAFTSETAMAGDTWTGTVKDPVIVGDRIAIPAGSVVTGTVSAAKAAEKGSRAFLVLALRSVEVNGVSHPLAAGTDSIVAGSTRARNVGAVTGGAAAGALIGKAIGGSGKGALIGGLIGGAAATGAVAASKGYQVEIREGAEITFSVNEPVVVKD